MVVSWDFAVETAGGNPVEPWLVPYKCLRSHYILFLSCSNLWPGAHGCDSPR